MPPVSCTTPSESEHPTTPDQQFAAETLVGAVSSMVTATVGVGESERLPELREPLMRLAAQLSAATG